MMLSGRNPRDRNKFEDKKMTNIQNQNNKSKSVLFVSLTGDLNAGAKRIGNNPELLKQIPDDLIPDLKSKFEKYNPLTEKGIERKGLCMENINLYQKSLDEIKSGLVTTPAKVFDAVSEAENVVQNTVVLELHLGRPSFGKVVKNDELEHAYGIGEALPETLRSWAKIIDTKHLKPYDAARSGFIGWLKAKSMPSGFLANGMYLVPLSLISQIDEKIEKFREEQDAFLNEFEAKYEDIKLEAKEKNAKIYRESNYLPFSEIRKFYKIQAKYLTLNVPAALEKVNKDLFEKEKEKSKQMWADAATDIRDGLRAGFKGLIDHFVSKLGKDDKGKKLVFHGSTVDKLKDFVTTFQDRNLTNDSELAELANQAKALIENVDPNSIRKDDTVRTNLEESFKKIQEVSETLIVAKTRKIQMD